jgi:cysteinyl-tRNA synthetase
MAWKHLGETFDIHGGGIDLVFPHHENEIAQSRCAFHTGVMANTWMHNGFLQVEGEKMSKSLGNFVTIHELLADWPGEVVRLNMLKTHYRQPIDWTVTGLREADRSLKRWREILFDRAALPDLSSEANPKFLSALAEDLNTPLAISHLHELASEAHVNAPAHGQFAASLELLGFFYPEFFALKFGPKIGHIVNVLLPNALGVEKRDPRLKYAGSSVRIEDAQKLPEGFDINGRIEARLAARKNKDFKESDRIRDELAAMGVVLKDSKDGTTWEVAR